MNIRLNKYFLLLILEITLSDKSLIAGSLYLPIINKQSAINRMTNPLKHPTSLLYNVYPKSNNIIKLNAKANDGIIIHKACFLKLF